MTYMCTVCGFDEMRRPPQDDYICPCCGTQFGLDDLTSTLPEIRRRWILRGCPWFSKRTLPPENWDSLTQVIDAGFDLTAEELRCLYMGHTVFGLDRDDTVVVVFGDANTSYTYLGSVPLFNKPEPPPSPYQANIIVGSLKRVCHA